MQLSNRLSSTEQQTSKRFTALDGLWLYRGVAAVLAGVAVYAYLDSGLSVKAVDLRNAVNVMVGASATILGFLVSAGALLYAVSNTTLARNLQRTQHFNRLLEDLFAAAACFLLALVVGLGCLFVPATVFGDTRFTKLEIGMQALIFSNILAYLLLFPVGHKMWHLLSSVTPDSGGRLE